MGDERNGCFGRHLHNWNKANYSGTALEYRDICALVFDSLVERFTVFFFFEKYYCCVELYRANDVLGSISNFNNWLGTVIPFQDKNNIIILRY